jgi:hypothetical protein
MGDVRIEESALHAPPSTDLFRTIVAAIGELSFQLR